MKYRKVFLIGSPWHAVLAMIFYERTDAILIEYASIASLSAIKKCLSEDAVILAEIESTEFYLSSHMELKNLSELFSLRRKIRALENSMKDIKSKEIVIFTPTSEVSKIVIGSLNFNDLVKIEDGICDYMPFNLLPAHSMFKAVLRKILIYALRLPNYYSKSEKLDFTYSFYFFPALIGSQTNKISLLNYKEKIIENISKVAFDSGHRCIDSKAGCLLIGQTLAEDRSCPLSDEIDIYKKVSENLIGSGHETIFFKPHPRSSAAKIELMKEYEASASFFEILDGDFPVEVLLVKYRFKSVVGLWSNPIILARILFDCESYSMMHELVSSYSLPHLLKIHKNLINFFQDDYVDYRCNK